MMHCRLLLFVFLCCGCWFRVQAQQNDTIESFNRYYLQSIDKLRDLYKVRGASFVCERMKNPYQEVSRMLRAYSRMQPYIGVLFYSYSKDTMRIWLLHQQRLSFHQAAVDKDALISAETDVRSALRVDVLLAARDAKNRGLSVKKQAKSRTTALAPALKRATDLLLPAPIAAQLAGIKHLIVIPEFNVSQFPLYLLQPWKNDSYLIDSTTVSIAPHLCNLAVNVEQQGYRMGSPMKLRPSNPVVVGNPAFTTSPEFNLAPLPGAESEAKQVATLLNTTPITGTSATLTHVLRQARQSNFLYFATHGYADLERGLSGSFLAFTPDEKNTAGLWDAKSIQQESFEADRSLAILSACQTGVGRIYDAGFIGIGRAFYKAGIDHTIMSLWSVDDAATAKLMTRLVTVLTQEELFMYPAAHLRQAILEYKKEDPNPAHWAPFMLFGFPF